MAQREGHRSSDGQEEDPQGEAAHRGGCGFHRLPHTLTEVKKDGKDEQSGKDGKDKKDGKDDKGKKGGKDEQGGDGGKDGDIEKGGKDKKNEQPPEVHMENPKTRGGSQFCWV